MLFLFSQRLGVKITLGSNLIKERKMIFISDGYLQKDIKRYGLYEMETEKHKQKTEMKVENERAISEHES